MKVGSRVGVDWVRRLGTEVVDNDEMSSESCESTQWNKYRRLIYVLME